MLNFLTAIVTAVMLWGTTNPVVYTTRTTVSDPLTKEIRAEWVTNHHWNGEEEIIRIEP